MIKFLIKVKNIILDILFPSICLSCNKILNDTKQKLQTTDYELQTKQYICDNCYNSIQLNTSLFCPVCRLRLAENKKICGCAAVIIKNDKNNIEHQYSYLLAAAGNYDDPVIRNLIHYFKYKSFEKLTPILGELLIKYIENCLPAGRHGKLKIENFVIVPIPLHRVKERQRGFNQSKLLAKYVADNFNLELTDILKKIKNTKPQACLRRQAQCKNNESRMENIKNCFKIKDSAIESIKNKNVLLIDDVFTTGSTINEAVKILKQNGAKRIIALVVAKA